MVCSNTKKRVASRLKLSGSLEKAKSSVRGLRSNRNVRSSVNKSQQSGDVGQMKSRNVTRRRRVISTKGQASTKTNSSLVSRSPAKSLGKKSNDESESEEEDVIVEPKKRVSVKNDRKAATRKVTTKRRNKLNDSVDLRQMSLKESFSKQVVSARLRPRECGKNYCEDSKTIENSQNCTVLLTEIIVGGTEKRPVYERVRVSDGNEQNRNDVYDFKFDKNDSRERKVRKKKRQVTRKEVLRKNLKRNLKKRAAEANALNVNMEKKTVPSEEIPQFKSEPIKVTLPDNEVTERAEPSVNTENIEDEPAQVNEIVNKAVSETVNESVNESNVSTDAEPAKSVKQPGTTLKPKVISVERINENTEIMVRSLKHTSGAKSDDSFRFQKSDAFAKPTTQYRSMMNHSLLNKSLSPIVKAYESFDVGSPWRPPQFSSFSQVKDMFQSTPHVKKLDVYTARIIRNANNTENVAPKQRMDAAVDKQNKRSSLTRKFGTEITNIDSSVTSSPNVINAMNSERNERVPEAPSTTPSIAQLTLPASPNASSFNDVAEDKENAAPNFQTPRKPLSKKKKKQADGRTQTQTLQKVISRRVLQTKENFEPQPGPSGLQSVSPTKVLRQSNLSGFLSLTPMPESSKISTPHGIFDDAHSTPVNGKQPKPVNQLKIVQTPQNTVKDAFGFSDSESDLDVSSISADDRMKETRKAPDKVRAEDVEAEIVIPARLSVGEIQRKLLVPKRARHKEPVQVKLTRLPSRAQENERKEEPRKKALIDISNFSDTFDVMSETGDSLKDESIKDVPLFADLEPSRFTEPPKHSYKRKRNVRFSFMDESSEENEDNVHEPEVKKKKSSKLNKADERRLKNWVESVNQTFEEIDQFDLVIE